MKNSRSIIFDFDGTLADSKEDVWRSIDAAAQAVSYSIPKSFRSDSRNLALSQQEIFKAICPCGNENALNHFRLVLQDHYLNKNNFENTVFYPGMEDLLKSLIKDGRELFIVSMKQFISLDKILKTKRWDLYFKKWFSPDGPGKWNKTKSELLNLVLQTEINLYPVIFVGDSWGDIRAAHENNIPAIGVLYGDGDTELLKQETPEYLAADVEAVQDLFVRRV
jgi:phosphoglycolate phosphatase